MTSAAQFALHARAVGECKLTLLLASLRARVAFATILFLLALPAAAQPALTLEEALRLAEQNHPQLAIARSQVQPAQAELAEAGTLLAHNPELTVEGRSRSLAQPDASALRRQDAAIGVAQTFETGGQPQARRAAARAALEGAQAAVQQARGEVRLEAGRRFLEALVLQRRFDSEVASASLVQQAAAIVAKRVRAGEDTRLDGNLALVEAERAQVQAAQTQAEATQAKAQLANALQLPAGTLPQPVGSLDFAPLPYTLDQLLQTSSLHPKLQALAARAQAARGRADLERAARSPDVTVGLNRSNERGLEGTDRITTLSITVPLPLFRRNEAAIARALAEQQQADTEVAAAQRETESAVRSLWLRTQQLHERVARLEKTVLPALRDNERLSLAALREGEINVTQFLLARRQTLEGQRDLLDARSQAALTRLELEAAAAWSPDAAAPSAMPNNSLTVRP